MGIIVLENIIKRYKNSVIGPINLVLEKNKTYCLIGNNGSGKTTLINIIANLTEYNKGNVIIKGQVISPEAHRYKKDFGFVLAEPYYIENFSVFDYLKFVCEFQGVHKVKIDSRILETTTLLGLQKELKSPIRQLSSGKQMGVSIAACLIHNPEIIVFDEPFVNLDIKTTQNITNIINRLRGQKTILITSHNLDLVLELYDSILIMDSGKILLKIEKNEYSSEVRLKQYIRNMLESNDLITDFEWLQ